MCFFVFEVFIVCSCNVVVDYMIGFYVVYISYKYLCFVGNVCVYVLRVGFGKE